MDFSTLLFRKRTKVPSISPEEALRPLDEPFKGALLSMYHGKSQVGYDGQHHEIDKTTRINPQQGMWIFQLCRDVKPEATLEIGMGYGFSTVYFLAARALNGSGHHTSIDPFQKEWWHGIALEKVKEVRMADSFQFINDYSTRAAADLTRANRRFQVIFIDGNHRFDDVLVDFTLFAPLCQPGGYMIFDDLWMPSVQTAVSFVRTNRADCEEVSTSNPNVAVFRMRGEDKRDWDHFEPFQVGKDSSRTGK